MRSLLARLFPFAAALVIAGSAAEALAAKPSAQTRSVAEVEFAIAASHPSMPQAERHTFAALLVRVARAHDFDALSGWAIIEHESHWQTDAVGRDGQDIGLAQIRYTADAVCQGDFDSEACQARREALFNPAANIAAMGTAISAWRDLCTRVTGKAPDTAQLLSGYGGYSRPSKQVYCNRQRVRVKGGGYVWKDLPTPKAVGEIVALREGMLTRLRTERAPRGGGAQPQPAKIQPAKAQPAKAQPAKVQPVKARPVKASPKHRARRPS